MGSKRYLSCSINYHSKFFSGPIYSLTATRTRLPQLGLGTRTTWLGFLVKRVLHVDCLLKKCLFFMPVFLLFWSHCCVPPSTVSIPKSLHEWDCITFNCPFKVYTAIHPLYAIFHFMLWTWSYLCNLAVRYCLTIYLHSSWLYISYRRHHKTEWADRWVGG